MGEMEKERAKRLKELREKQYELVKLTRYKPISLLDYYLLPRIMLLVSGIVIGIALFLKLGGVRFSLSLLIGLAVALGGTYLFDYKGNYLKYPFTLEDETVIAKLIISLKRLKKRLKK